MIFSVLEKIEKGDRAFSDRELAMLLPYLDKPELEPVLDRKALLQVGHAVKNDKEWFGAINARLAYDIMFGSAASPVLTDLIEQVMKDSDTAPDELGFALERAATEGDIRTLRRVTGLLSRLPDIDGEPALGLAIAHDECRALRLAAAKGHRECVRHLLNCALKPGHDKPRVDAKKWMSDDRRMVTIVGTAMGESAAHQDTVDMLLNQARRAGIEAEVMQPVMLLLLYFAAKSGDPARLHNVWNRCVKVHGPDGMSLPFLQGNGNLIAALATDPDGGQLDRLLRLYEKDVGRHLLANVLRQPLQIGGAVTPGITTILETARRVEGQKLVDEILRSRNYFVFQYAGMREDAGMLRTLEAQSSGESFMYDMLKGSFMASFIARSSIPCIVHMAARTRMLCGDAPLELMMKAMGGEAVASRPDYMSVLAKIQMIAQTLKLRKNTDIAMPRSVIDALMAYKDKKMPGHEFWQRVGGGADRWREVTNHPAPTGVEPLSSPWNFKPQMYRELLPHMKRLCALEQLPEDKAATIAYRLSVIFANKEEAERHIDHAVRRSRPDSRLLPFTKATNFLIPARGLWNVPHWRAMLSKYGQSVNIFIQTAPEIELYCAKNNMPLPKTHAEIIDVARFVIYREALAHPEFARLALQHDLPPSLFNKGLKILQQGKMQDALPVVTIDGADIGKPNYYMQKLPANDPRGLILGHITNNCQTLGGNGEYAAVDGMTSPLSGFYVWKQKTKGQMTEQDRIVAQSWAWIGQWRSLLGEKEVVFDSFERLSGVYNHLARPFMEQYTYDLTTKGELSAVFLGAGGGTPPDMGWPKAQEPAQPCTAQPQTPDSKVQYAVAPVNHRKPA